MPHYFDTGFTVREPAWHGLGNVLAAHPENWDEARMAAGLMWEPRLVPLYRQMTDGSYVELDGSKLIERDDTGAELATVSATYELLSNGEMGPLLEAIQGEGPVRYETAGSVRGGRTVWALLLLDEPYAIDGDVDGFGDPVLTLPYLALLNSHDGTGACKATFTQVRVVCANTVQAADAEGNRHGQQFTFRHTTGMKDRIEAAKDALTVARLEAQRWRDLATQLHDVSVSGEQQLMFLEEFMPMPPAGAASDRVRANVERDRGRFMTLLNDSATNCGISHTGLGLVNAATEYLDHVRGFANRDTYLGRQLLRPEPLKAKAVKLAMAFA